MKKRRTILLIILCGIILFMSALTIKSEAVEETKNTTNTQSSSSKQTSETTNTAASKNNTSSNTGSTKSSNANLSNLGIRPHDFKGFRAATTTYEVVVPEDTEEVEVYAKTQHAKATVTGTGKKKLEVGENEVEVVVTAEDGTKKTYTLHIVREMVQENYEEGEESTNKEGLSELKIKDLNLSPEFKTDIYEYSVKYIGEDTKLSIETKPTDETYTVEVVGNEDLKEGENTITILVSKKNGDNVATYQVIVNKSLVDAEAIAREEAQKKEQQKRMIIGAIAAVIVIAVIILIIRRKRKRDLEEDWDQDFEEELEEDEEEMPKALRKNKKQIVEEPEEIDEEDEIEDMSKEDLRERFLNNYFSYAEEEEDRESRKRRPKKGKRFK